MFPVLNTKIKPVLTKRPSTEQPLSQARLIAIMNVLQG